MWETGGEGGRGEGVGSKTKWAPGMGVIVYSRGHEGPGKSLSLIVQSHGGGRMPRPPALRLPGGRHCQLQHLGMAGATRLRRLAIA